MTEEQPAFSLVTDNSRFIRKPGEAPPDIGATADLSGVDTSTLHLREAHEEGRRNSSAANEPQIECAICKKTWAESYIIPFTRQKKGGGEILKLCPVCHARGDHERDDSKTVRVRGSDIDTTKLFIRIAAVLTLASGLIFWKFYSDSAAQKVDWDQTAWCQQPPEKWPALLVEWQARVKGAPTPLRSSGFFLQRTDGKVLAVGFAPTGWLSGQGVRAAKFSDVKLDAAVLRGAGGKTFSPAVFATPVESPSRTLWPFTCDTPAAQLPAEPLKVRKQPLIPGIAGRLVCFENGRQTVHPCRVTQGMRGGDEFTLLMDAPLAAAKAPGSLLIDEFGHIMAIGERLVETTGERAGRNVFVRNALVLVGLEK